MKNLANQLRPNSLNDIIGQKKIVKILKKIVNKKATVSFVFFGESGIGKTTCAFAMANDMGLTSGYFNASVDSKADLVEILEKKDIVIIDEIHRLNKDKQDILLSYLEFDRIIVYATTTENPYFRVNPALRSRLNILEFEKLSEQDILDGLKKINALPEFGLNISDELMLEIAQFSGGDYRSSINNFQMLSMLVSENHKITKEDIKTIIPNINFYSDMKGSAHYNNLSAFHKSLRGSDADAALYYGALILKTGDYQGLIRRMSCVAFEDIGLANPNIVLRVEAAINAIERLGFPEANLAVGFCIVDLALSPKSNSTYLAFNKAMSMVDSGKIYQIPKHLRDNHYASASKLGDGNGYKYPHDFVNNWINQKYLPTVLKDTQFYNFGENDNEQKYKKYWEHIKKLYVEKGNKNGQE